MFHRVLDHIYLLNRQTAPPRIVIKVGANMRFLYCRTHIFGRQFCLALLAVKTNKKVSKYETAKYSFEFIYMISNT